MIEHENEWLHFDVSATGIVTYWYGRNWSFLKMKFVRILLIQKGFRWKNLAEIWVNNWLQFQVDP